ncbi:MAG TPA: DUF2203 domain-containing protein [Ktedonobacter sp.]|nr:DUF2203 domain-containing protein [Ktedonobacter sp.]
MPHYFTREEAESLLPQITVILQAIQTTRQEARNNQLEIESLQDRLRNNGHGLHERIVQLRSNLEEHIHALRQLRDELQRFGCELKDPDTGLIDFLSLRNGTEVYLCWRLGEDRIRFWHTLDGGVAGRQPL